MADPETERKLRPSARQVSAAIPTVRSTSGELPQALDQIGQVLGEDVVTFLDRREARADQEAREIVAANPNITEEELVEQLGGHRNLARRLLTEQEGFIAGQEFTFQARRELFQSPARDQGPEAVREVLQNKLEQFQESAPEDPDFRAGSLAAIGDFVEREVLASADREAETIVQRQENLLAQEIRGSLVLDDPQRTVERVRGLIESGEVAGLPAQRLRAGVIDTFREVALRDPFQGEEMLLALAQGEDPFIQDPQERATLARAVQEVRNVRHQAELRAEEQETSERREAERAASFSIYQSILTGGQPSPEDVERLAAAVGPDKVGGIISNIRDSVAQPSQLSPQAEARWKLAILEGVKNEEDILAANLPSSVALDLVELARQNRQDTSQTRAFKAGMNQLKAQIRDNTTGFLTGTASADALRAYEARTRELVRNDPSLVEDEDRMFVLFSEVARNIGVALSEPGDPEQRRQREELIGAPAAQEPITRTAERLQESSLGSLEERLDAERQRRAPDRPDLQGDRNFLKERMGGFVEPGMEMWIGEDE